MEFARSFASNLIGGLLMLFSGRDALFSLAPLGVLLGIAMLWVFRRTSNPEAFRRAKGRLQAHLYELRLFADEPLLIWRAQRGLVAANVRYLRLMLAPALVMTIPMLAILAQMECFYGISPLAPGRETIVTMQWKEGLGENAPAAVLRAPDGIAVETPAVRALGSRQVSWRIRALRPIKGKLEVVVAGQTVEKSVQAGAGPSYLSERRVSSALELLWHPAERRLTGGPVEWIEVRYPPATVHALGLDLPWVVWLLLFSMASALLLKRRFRVVF